MTSDPLRDLPPCRNCGAPTGRWGWFDGGTERVVYVICYDCLAKGTEPAVQVASFNEIPSLRRNISHKQKIDTEGIAQGGIKKRSTQKTAK